jgi:ferritin-like protein
MIIADMILKREDYTLWKIGCEKCAALQAEIGLLQRKMTSPRITEMEAQIEALQTRIKELTVALEDAAKSLMTISDGAGKEMLTDIMQISGYANSRANAAKAAVTAHKEGGQ